MYPPDTGMGYMPPVEREMAALTSLGPEWVTANPRCPVKECEKTNHLVCRSYSAATWAARSGNALAILMAALRRTANPEDQDTMSLIDSTLVTHSQLTRDVGVVMSSAMMSRRQNWLAQTSLPENIRKELTNMPIVPARVFHHDFQGVLDKARQSHRTRDCVRHTVSRTTAPMYGSRGPQHSNHPTGTHQEPWRQRAVFPASGGTQPRSCHQRRFQPLPSSKEVSHRRRPPRGTGRQAGVP